ncbi:MAG: hypothetical protein JO072_15555 [Parafilimonas sp.]|nr:hypothetical protein [Parafilimonas sp.]
MKTPYFALVITIINLIIMTIVLTKVNPAMAQQTQNTLQVLRGKGLEVIDSMGRIRASISFHSAITQNGKFYPEGVLFRLIDAKGQPSVKIDVTENGSGISLSNEAKGFVQIASQENGGFLKIKSAGGAEKTFQP